MQAKGKALMNEISRDSIMDALRAVKDPVVGSDIVSLGMVSGVQMSQAGEVIFMIEVDAARGPSMEGLRQEAERAVAKIPGVKKASAILTAERSMATPGPARAPSGKLHIPAIKSMIAVASGKGGVGKSTVAANLAVALAKGGLKVGLLDADIYGPSQPRMMGLQGQKPGGEEGKIEPLMAHGVKVMSIGFMIAEEAPLIWRGPMVQSAITQLLRDVSWGTLDVLIIDLPPGTGDAQLSLAQRAPLTGAVIVSTPQDIALIDARKGLEMFVKVGVPVLGIVENMSYFQCPSCGHEEHIFGHDGAREEAAKLGCDFLGEIPLHKDIRSAGDNGAPIVAVEPDGEYARAFMEIAARVMQAVIPSEAAHPMRRAVEGSL